MLSGYNAGLCLTRSQERTFLPLAVKQPQPVLPQAQDPQHVLFLHAVVELGQDLKILLSLSTALAAATSAAIHPEFPSTPTAAAVSSMCAD